MTTDEIFKREKRLADIRQRRDLEKLDEPVKAKRWANLWFRTNGESSVGQSFDSEAEALKYFQWVMTNKNQYLEWRNGPYVRDGKPSIHKSEVSHAIQIPVLP